MAYVPGCRFDLFISYASENDRDGWVEQFAKALGQELCDLLGRQFSAKESVFFDKRELEVAQSFRDTLAGAARDSAILVPVLSPGYLTSLWCNRERTEFFSKLPHGASPADCLAPILIRPVDETGLDAAYRYAQRLSFLEPDAQTPLPPGSPEWTARLREFAGQLKNALQALRRKCKPVFLGKAGATERAETLRVWCSVELERRNFRTVPESLPALDDSDAVLANLEAAGLAVHFLGGADAHALAAIEISVAVCAGPTILYQPFGAGLTPDELLWLAEFERELPSTYQRLAGKHDQELLALIDEQITRVREATAPPLAQPQLALVCEEVDLDAVRQLKDAIQSRRALAVDFPDFLGGRLKAMERLRKWDEYLARGETLLFYLGAGERLRLHPIWLKAEQNRPVARRDWFLAQPDLDGKRLKQPEALWNIDQVIRFLDR
jgi:hypothetical protein